jgi:hypothetical protein
MANLSSQACGLLLVPVIVAVGRVEHPNGRIWFTVSVSVLSELIAA